MHFSPAASVVRLLIQEGVCSDAESSPLGVWPVVYGGMPPLPTDVVGIRDTTGVLQSRLMLTGAWISRKGIQVRLRSASYDEGLDKITSISDLFDGAYRKEVWFDDDAYLIQNISRTTDPVFIGTMEKNLASEFSVNAFVSIKKL